MDSAETKRSYSKSVETDVGVRSMGGRPQACSGYLRVLTVAFKVVHM